MHPPIILGRPFLAIAVCHIDLENGESSFHRGDDHVEFNLSMASKLPLISYEYNGIDVTECLMRKEDTNQVFSGLLFLFLSDLP